MNLDFLSCAPFSTREGGADSRYTFVNGTDYTKDNITSGVKYQLQAIHRTLVHHYNDTLDFLVISNSSDMSIARVSLRARLL